MRHLAAKVLAISLATLPLSVVQAAATFEGLFGAEGKIRTWMNLLVPLVIGAGLLYFIWGLAMFIGNSGDEKGREEGKSRMVWGILGMFVMVSIWGIIAFIGGSGGLDIGQGGTFEPPKF